MFCEIDVSQADIINAIESVKKVPTRMNVGALGRGDRLSEYCQDHIKEMASYYDGVNFSKIGI